MNSTTYAKRTSHKPVDILFRAVLDAKSKTKKVAFVDALQVLNDQYLGRLNVCNYFAVAEDSVRVNELNIIALEELKNYHLVMKENFLIPDKTLYCLPVSVNFLESNQDFDILLSALKNNGYKKGSVILSFHGATLERLDGDGRKRYVRLRRSGYKIAVTQFGEEYNSIDIFADFAFDYLRCEAQYFDASQNKKKLLSMLVKYCNANKIGLVMDGVDSPGQLTRFKRAGVKFVTGNAVSKLSPIVTNEFLCLPALEDEKKDAYLAKLKKELDVKQKAELSELNELQKVALEKAKAQSGEGAIPIAPRPELAKSPYQIRLEEQRKCARQSAEAMFTAQASDVYAPVRPTEENEQKKKNVQADLNAEAKLLEEYRSGGMFGGLGAFDGPKGFGVTLKIDSDEKDIPSLVGSYNEKGQWVDEDGNVFDGYFDVDGKWIEYEQFDVKNEGHYNDDGQWVDLDGVAYDGYFDEDGRWIDYTYSDQNGEIVDNGYFDDKIGKWVPFGYFAEEGSYHRF